MAVALEMPMVSRIDSACCLMSSCIHTFTFAVFVIAIEFAPL